ncbi:MAG TPA: hypothetical protein VK590_14365 [Saprospiraceae bacterium]|nr:hypothetical protein [Saprospiraceae bacterium]
MKIKVVISILIAFILNLSCNKCELIEQTITTPTVKCEGSFFINKRQPGGTDLEFTFNEFRKPYPIPFITVEREGPFPVGISFSTMVSNFSTYDPISKRYFFEYFNPQANTIVVVHSDNTTASTSSFSDPKNNYVGPVYANGKLYAIKLDQLNPGVNYQIVEIDPVTGQQINILISKSFVGNSPYLARYLSSVSNGNNLLYFLSGTNLVEYNISANSSTNYEIDSNYDPVDNNVQYYGLEYEKDKDQLIAMKNTFNTMTPTTTELVSIKVSGNATIVTKVFDITANLPVTHNKDINPEFYSTTFDSCDNSYYITEVQSFSPFTTNLFEINLKQNTFNSQLLSEYWYGIEFVPKL